MDSFLADVLASAGFVALERLADGSLRILGTVPEWFARLYPQIAATPERFSLGPECPFLENFLVDAEAFWHAPEAAALESGIWTESDPTGEFHLQASAIRVAGRKTLLIEFLGAEGIEKQRILQAAREDRLSLAERQRAVTALQAAVETLEKRVAERAADLTRATERLNREQGERTIVEATLRRSEERFREVERMRILGQVAAGIAHDFRNVLSVIIGSCDHLGDFCGADSPSSKYLGFITTAAERATLLIHQLLAFSSGQLLKPQVLDLNAVVTNVSSLLRRLVGEHIELLLDLAPSLGYVRADAGQLDQVLMNLVVNARDAMPNGGRLTIQTSRRSPDSDPSGQANEVLGRPHTVLIVSDTGCGMDPDTQARIFERFFTTKEPGQGTGLGLSTVQDILQQAGGTIKVESEPGRGSTFTIYLPQVA